MKSSKRRIVFRLVTLAAILALAAAMFVVGRGHTIYFDNKALTADGKTYDAFYQIEIFVDDVSVAKVKEGDRGMTTTMGQNFSMVLHITPKKGGKKVGSAVSMKIPYNMDGIVLNIPALLNGAPEEVYMEEFVPAPETTDDEEVVVTEDMGLGIGE